MQQILNLRNRMREIRSSGSVGERGGNDPLYPESLKSDRNSEFVDRLFEYSNNVLLCVSASLRLIFIFSLLLAPGVNPDKHI